ncbi:hypothetical protein RP20_CCG012365 [Aedes albopictus]|nr:hypothetical protein RP20_CCG012365 [Aedes albopictus]
MDFWNKFGVKPICCTMQATTAEEEDEQTTEEPMKDLTSEERRLLDEVVARFPKAGAGTLGRTNIYEHRIDVGDAVPRKQRYYPMSQYVLQEVNREIDRMIALDVIKEANFSPWNNPLVAVKKKTGQYRVCLDARHLNSVMVNEGYLIPQISSIIGNLGGCSYISTIDLKDAFWQLPLHPTSRPLTAFTVPSRGHFQFKVVPFGLCTASQALARVMTHLFADMEPFVFHYLDDIVICSRTFEEHLRVLEEVARRLRAANLTISAEKSKFCREEIKYLGYVLNEKGWQVDNEKVECIVRFPVPESRRDVQRFIGLCNWYRRFIVDFARTAAPLTELTKTKTKFRWTSQAEEAFLKLKSMLVTAPVLIMPDYTKPFSVACDASDVAIGAVLTQEIDGDEHPVCYFSQKLSSSERKYSVTERECLAVIRAIEKFRGYIEGVKFTVHCDHAALSYLKSLKNPTALMSRWLLRLNAFDFEIKYRKGSINVVPDALSRIVSVATFSANCTEDTWYKKTLEQASRKPNSFADFRVVNNELYKNCRSRDETGAFTHQWRKAVPQEQRKEIIKRYHDAPAAAHLGIYKTMQKIKSHFYWPKMQDDIYHYVRNCEICKASKSSNSTLMPTMDATKPAKLPWELISIDFVGPFTRSKQGNTVMLVIVDWVTKYVVIQAMRAADAAKTVEFLENEVFLKFSHPRIILSDNGKQFQSVVFRSMLARHKIQHMKTAYYCPMVNNAERVNRVLVTCIRSLIDDDHRNWDEHLSSIAAAINSAKHESTGVSPHYANFGRELLLFTDLYQLQDMNTEKDAKQSQDRRLAGIQRIQKFIAQRIKENHEKSKQRYDLRKRSAAYKEGDIVWRRTFELSSKVDKINQKLKPKFTPAIIRKVLGVNLYELEDVVTGRTGRYHDKDIKTD